MAYDLFLGCVIPARLPYLEVSSRKVFEKLGIELRDVDGFSCCPDPTGIELIDHKTWLALGARNLSLCNKNGGVISFCSGCVETLKGVNYYINKEPPLKEEVNKILKKVGKTYDGSVEPLPRMISRRRRLDRYRPGIYGVLEAQTGRMECYRSVRKRLAGAIFEVAYNRVSLCGQLQPNLVVPARPRHRFHQSQTMTTGQHPVC